jgi:hypothetical protein
MNAFFGAGTTAKSKSKQWLIGNAWNGARAAHI